MRFKKTITTGHFTRHLLIFNVDQTGFEGTTHNKSCTCTAHAIWSCCYTVAALYSQMVMVNTATASSSLGVSLGTATVHLSLTTILQLTLHRPLLLRPALLLHCHSSLIVSRLTLLMCLLSHLGCRLIQVLSMSLLWELMLNLLSDACTTLHCLNFRKSSDS